jgi:hypothetical protein
MATKADLTGGSFNTFKRPLSITSNVFETVVDPMIKMHLDELNEILGYSVFSDIKEPVEDAKEEAGILYIIPSLKKRIIPKKTTKDQWDNNGIINDMVVAYKVGLPDLLSINDWIDKVNDLLTLRLLFRDQIDKISTTLDFNTRSVLSYKNISDYLVAYCWFVKDLKEVNPLVTYIINNQDCVRNIVNYGVISVARNTIQKESINIKNYNDDNHPLILNLQTSQLSFSNLSFKNQINKKIHNYLSDSPINEIIENEELIKEIGFIPENYKPLLIQLIKDSPVIITKGNSRYYIPSLIRKIQESKSFGEITTAEDIQGLDSGFEVERIIEDPSSAQINTLNVKCAAQLFYSMTLGDELDVFSVMNFFTHKYLVRGDIAVQDRQLRDDLQMYVFSNKFTDLKSGRIMERTRPAERSMFYKQVFNYGASQVSEDVIINTEFPKLWKVLIFESARYIERVQDSPTAQVNVSMQNIMQAIEDLQYNLSTHCTGMANVITPIIYSELNFIIKRIFMHKDILSQVVPVGGTWWKVVEMLFGAMRSSKPKSMVLYNKAILGYDVINSIAVYDPIVFQDTTEIQEKNCYHFVSKVDAFITTQSILQKTLTDDIRKEHVTEEEEKNESSGSDVAEPVEYSTAPGKNAGDEWDF